MGPDGRSRLDVVCKALEQLWLGQYEPPQEIVRFVEMPHCHDLKIPGRPNIRKSIISITFTAPHKYCSNEPPNLIDFLHIQSDELSPHILPENASNPQTKAQSDTIAPSCSSDAEQISSQNNTWMAVNQDQQMKAKTIMTSHGFLRLLLNVTDVRLPSIFRL